VVIIAMTIAREVIFFFMIGVLTAVLKILCRYNATVLYWLFFKICMSVIFFTQSRQVKKATAQRRCIINFVPLLLFGKFFLQ
jgi:hypothetical protein